MAIPLSTLNSMIEPTRTVLMLGAGAAVPSGAPTGPELATRLWADVAKSPPQTDDLIDTTSILERRFGRRSVVDSVVSVLKSLRPTGGLLALPRFGWSKVFSTNFDQLVEAAYKASGIPLSVFRSNFDFSIRDATASTALYKIHGCITQDRSLGDKASMILTEGDYENFKSYRQSLFSTLAAALQTQDVLIIGQSLRDRHLSDLVKEVLALRNEGLPGRVFVLVYDKDDLRAPLLEDRGAQIIFGGIDALVGEMISTLPAAASSSATAGTSLPVELLPITFDVRIQRASPTNTKRMFNGGPASYSDVASGATFERGAFAEASADLGRNDSLAIIVTGAAGVGKTTFARQLLLDSVNQGMQAWEHRPDYPFKHKLWLEVEQCLRSDGLRGVLLIDECTHYLRAVNLLFDALAKLEKPALSIVITANSAQWTPRVKSPVVFTRGRSVNLSRLTDSEINSLINLVDSNPSIAALTHSGFRSLKRVQRFNDLKRKASADMFVCLKNIFAKDGLDTILLEEFDALDPDLQDYYRYVAALEAVGARVHRQLIIRMLNLPIDNVSSVLSRLDGIIDEYDISTRDGIYGWNTRHLVIARRITEYKFSGIEELRTLFENIIANINPANLVELQSVRDLCDVTYGIGRLGDPKVRQSLYRSLIGVAPGERVPWHRLIRELLENGDLDDVEHELRNAEEAVNSDAPLDRYKVRLLLARAKQTGRISDVDRLALVRRAYETALINVDRHKHDKVSFYTLCDVAFELVDRGESEYLVEQALAKLREAGDYLYDPEISERIRSYERRRTIRR